MRPWLEPALRVQRIVASAFFAATTLALLLFGEPPLVVQWSVLVLALALVGLPHGALDLDLLRTAAGRSARGLALRAGAYLLVGLAAVGLWLTAPAPALIVFLAISAWHFGEAELREHHEHRVGVALAALARGALPILLPMVLHADDVARLFSLLLVDGSSIEARALAAVARPAALGAIAIAFLVPLAAEDSLRGRRAARARLLVMALCLVIAPPLIGFTLYFALWHSLRELLREAAARDSRRPRRALGRLARAAFPATAATMALGAGAALILPTASADALTAQIVFIGLAGLTVPHMLVPGWLARESESSASAG